MQLAATITTAALRRGMYTASTLYTYPPSLTGERYSPVAIGIAI
jgi:hypothetical protein